jgi:sterol 3beta-glucosyltransferase
MKLAVASFGLGHGSLPASVLAVDYIPHDWLFPKAACIVHHGGAGTTAAALRAGKPQVVVWHLGDQQSWGKLLHRRGVAPAAIHHHALTPERLSRALIDAADPRREKRGSLIGEQIRSEDGLGEAVRAIERAISARPG